MGATKKEEKSSKTELAAQSKMSYRSVTVNVIRSNPVQLSGFGDVGDAVFAEPTSGRQFKVFEQMIKAW